MDGGDGADGTSAHSQNLEPQDSRNLELGVKWDVLGGRLALTGAAFQTEMNNARVSVDASTQENIGKKRVKGVEVGFSGKLTDEWSEFGGYTYLDAKVLDNGFTNDGGVFVPSPLNGPVPEHAGAGREPVDHVRVLRGAGPVLGGGTNDLDMVYGNVNNTKWVPSYTRLDTMASYAFSPNYNPQLNLHNRTDKLYFTKAYTSHHASIAPA